MIVARTCAIYHYRSWITDWHSHPTRWFYFTVKVVQFFRAVGSNGASYTFEENDILKKLKESFQIKEEELVECVEKFIQDMIQFDILQEGK